MPKHRLIKAAEDALAFAKGDTTKGRIVTPKTMKAVVTICINFEAPVTKKSIKDAVVYRLMADGVGGPISAAPPNARPEYDELVDATKVTIRSVDID